MSVSLIRLSFPQFDLVLLNGADLSALCLPGIAQIDLNHSNHEYLPIEILCCLFYQTTSERFLRTDMPFSTGSRGLQRLWHIRQH